MSYLTQSKMAQDYGLIMRIAACAASEGVPGDPTMWADGRRQKIVALPGWADKYASAQKSGNLAPGEDESVITDDDILTAVQVIIAAESEPKTAPDTEEPAPAGS